MKLSLLMFRGALLSGALLTGLSGAQALAQPAADRILVEIDGQVLNPGVFSFPEGARLSQAAATGQVSANAWFLGAALLRKDAEEQQVRLKAGVLFDLQVNAVHAKATGNAGLLELAERLNTLVEPMPVTGRVVAEMNPLAQLLPQNNALLRNGDRLRYPLRPAQVRVMGAVKQDCVLPHVPGQQPVDYLESCPRHDLADPNHLYLVQPDGSVSKTPIAYWNAQPANLAVGGIIFVPLQRSLLSPDALSLNEDMAALLATQYPLGGRFDE